MGKYERIRIVGDGTSANTKVLDVNGEPIPFVAGVHLVLNADEPLAKCWLKLVNVEVDLETNVDIEEHVDAKLEADKQANA